jgi:crotonobetainyl-CoA:carnitine CoA-transferase CaiB-like acyl-CoA transferase
VNKVSEALEMEQTKAREMLQDVEQAGAGTMTICGPTLKVPDTPLGIQGPAPVLGQHTRQVLSSLLGYSKVKLDELEEKGIIAGEEG